MSTTTVSIFDQIATDATVIAAAPVVEADADLDFRPYSERTEPSDGFVDSLAVQPATKVPHGYQWAAIEACLTASARRSSATSLAWVRRSSPRLSPPTSCTRAARSAWPCHRS